MEHQKLWIRLRRISDPFFGEMKAWLKGEVEMGPEV
jgi:hypothetical protein